MNKRGQLTATQLGLLILAIAGFALAMLFLFGVFKNEDLAERDICRLSILSRATAPIASQAIPLSCFTEKICITVPKGGVLGIGGKDNSCKQFAGEKNVKPVEVIVNGGPGDALAIRKIEETTANAMFDCWIMTGQGKLDAFKGTTEGAPATLTSEVLNFLGSDLDSVIKTIKPQCLVCSRVALSEGLLEKDSKFHFLDKVNVNEYMAREKVPGSSLTYLQSFTDESVRSYAGIDQINRLDNQYANHSFGGPQMAILFMQIKTEGNPTEIGAQAAILAGTAIGGGGLLTGIGRQTIKTFPIVSTIAAIAGVGGAYLAAQDIAEDNQAISFAACKEYEKNKDSSKLGCSLIKPVVWNAAQVNSICAGGIEGNL